MPGAQTDGGGARFALSATRPGDDPGAVAQVRALQRWLEEDGLAELPAEHGALASQPFGVRVDLSAVAGSPWREAFFSQHAAIGLSTWVTWTCADGTPGEAFAPPGVAWAMSGNLFELMCRLPGDRIELCYALAGRLPLLPRGTWIHPDGWWDEWKSRPVDATDDAMTLGDIYRRQLYPRVLACLERFAPFTTVVDVCGGDGELAVAVAARFPGAQVTVLERNRAACEAARAHERLAVVCADAAAPWPALPAQDAALLIGAVQGNVMTADAAEAVVAETARALRPGGFAVVAGWSPCLLDRRGFEALGFEVLNCAVPPTDDDPNPRQLYLLRKV
jgi:SAM-dependent methyltransferase